MTSAGPHDRTPRPSLTPPAFPTALSQPQAGRPAPIAMAPTSPRPVPVAPRRRHSAVPYIIGALALLLVALVGYFLTFIGTTASLVGMILALIPLAVVLFAVRIIDRWEPEPRSLVVLAVAWGAVASVVIALLVDLSLDLVFGAGVGLIADVLTSVVQAPIVEEIAKGLGVLLILGVGRRSFDGPVDGVVYGAVVGAGFAFTENIQYFAVSLLEGGVEQAGATFFVRGILSPFAHVMFTAVTGFAIGLAARRGGGGAFGAFFAGLVGAIVLHALWNGSALLGDFWQLYVVLQVPLFIGFMLGIVALRREEERLTRARLGDYAAAGWFTPQEVDMLATRAGRRAGIAWAGTLRGDRVGIMKAFIADAAKLAAARQRAISGRDPQAADEERMLLARTVQARNALFAL